MMEEKKPQKILRNYRIAWMIGGATGNGLPFPISKYEILQRLRDDCNARYGSGTHWIEEIEM